MTEHAKLSASSAHRWMRCPGSIKACEGIPDTSSEAADIGTAAHALMERCLIEAKPPSAYIDHEYEVGDKAHIFDTEMVENVQECLDYIKRHITSDYVIRSEHKVHYDFWVEDGFGTIDVLATNDKEEITKVFDLKYGYGKVEAENNPQLGLYALGARATTGYDCEIHIMQPRINNWQVWKPTKAELFGFGEELAFAAAKALEEDAPRIPGVAQCRFCPARENCAERIEQAVEGLNEMHLSSPEGMSAAEIGAVLDKADYVKAFLKEVTEKAKAMLGEGVEIPNWHLVPGRRTRSWHDEAKFIDALKRRKRIKSEDFFIRKLMSPAQVEKKLGKKHPLLAEHVKITQGVSLGKDKSAADIRLAEAAKGFEEI